MRKKGATKRLIDYIITDHSIAEFFSCFVSGTPIGTIGKKPIDHLATSVITNIRMTEPSKVFRKTEI